MEDWKKEFEEERKRWKKALDDNKKLPEGLVEGKNFSVGVADGKVMYQVVEIGNTVSKVKKEIGEIDYNWDAVDSKGNILTSVLKNAINRCEGLQKIFG